MGARHFGIGKETNYGTAVAPTVFMEALGETLQDQKSYDRIIPIRAYSVRELVELNSAVRGDVETVADFQTLADLWSLFLAGADTTGAGPYTHTSPKSTGIPATGRIGYSATIEMRRDGSLNWRYAGGKLVGISLAVSSEQAARARLSWITKDETTPAPATPSWRDFDVLKPGHASVSFDATGLQAVGWNLNVAWPIDEPFGLGNTRFLVEPVDSDALTVTGDATVFFTDTTQYAKFVSQANVDVQLVVNNGTESMTINLNKCRLMQATPPVEGRNRLRVTYEFESGFDTAATENIQVVTVNDQATPLFP